MEDKEIKTIQTIPEKFNINNIKTLEEMKAEFGTDYDKYMYDMNLEFLKGLTVMDIKNYDLQQELSKANNKLKRIHRLIHAIYFTGLRNGKTVINDVFQEIDDIIDEKLKGDEDK